MQGLNPLRGSGPLQGRLSARGISHEVIQTSATGPRLSNEGAMRSSAEAYLRGSTEVNGPFTLLEICACSEIKKKLLIKYFPMHAMGSLCV